MKLYIAEKPSLARAIATALPRPHKKNQGYIELGNGDIVTWCIGHILEQAAPEAYDEKYKKWQLETLPIIPSQWQLKAKFQTKSQLAVIRKLVKQAKVIIHAGDPDREGQLLVDEVIDFLKVNEQKKHTMQRLLISDLNIPAVKRALAQLQPNKNFMPLSISALARSRADWLYGINLTRAYTIQGGKVGYQGVLSVGRVQTPILGMVVKRDHDINNFVSKPFYQVMATINVAKQPSFQAKWYPSEACQPYMDEEGRVLIKALAENVISRIKDQPATVTEVSKSVKKQNPPLPFNLSTLQIAAAKQLSINAKMVLDICQSLYEKHKLITYPRSDCRYLPTEQLAHASTIIANLTKYPTPIAQAAENADLQLKSAAWNNKKVTAHHAIIPTEKCATKAKLSPLEDKVYQLIARHYLAQFYPVYLAEHYQITLTIAGGTFKAKTITDQQLGWKTLFTNEKQLNAPETENQQQLPKVEQADILHCSHGELLTKQTQAPQAFTDASLLSAITGINRFVKDKQLKKVLKDTDGLGTEATRASIIELLFKRGFLVRTGKQINASKAGIALIDSLPEQCTLPDMTAHWELTLNNIAEKKANYHEFITPLTNTIYELIAQASKQLPTPLQGVTCTQKPAFKKRRKKKATAKV